MNVKFLYKYFGINREWNYQWKEMNGKTKITIRTIDTPFLSIYKQRVMISNYKTNIV